MVTLYVQVSAVSVQDNEVSGGALKAMQMGSVGNEWREMKQGGVVHSWAIMPQYIDQFRTVLSIFKVSAPIM